MSPRDPADHPLAAYLAPARLVATAGPVTLRMATDGELASLAARVADGGLDDAAARAGLGAWVHGDPATVAARVAAYRHHKLSGITPDAWRLPLTVFTAEGPVGAQDLSATARLADLGVVATGSWLVGPARGRGYATWARGAALALAWALGARRATTSWVVDNAASAAVSARHGYRLEGHSWDVLGDPPRAVTLQRAAVTPDRHARAWPHPVAVAGVDAEVRAALGAPDPPAPA